MASATWSPKRLMAARGKLVEIDGELHRLTLTDDGWCWGRVQHADIRVIRKQFERHGARVVWRSGAHTEVTRDDWRGGTAR